MHIFTHRYVYVHTCVYINAYIHLHIHILPDRDQGTHTNWSRHTYEWTCATKGGVWTIRLKWVVSHIMNGSCDTYKWVTLHIRDEPWQGAAWRGEVHWTHEVWWVMSHVMSHIWMRCVTHMNESCHTYDGTCVTRKGLLNSYSNSFLVMGAGSLAPAAITMYSFTHLRWCWQTWQLALKRHAFWLSSLRGRKKYTLHIYTHTHPYLYIYVCLTSQRWR